MANIVIPSSIYYPTMIGGVSLKAAGLVAATAAATGVVFGHGSVCVQVDWTACEIATGDEFYMITVEAQDASAVWTNIGVVAVLGAAAVATEGDAPAAGSARIAVRNPFAGGGSQIRVKCWVRGTIATGINYSATAYPEQNLNY